jgi:molybdate transport system ATP-binding protein
VPQEGLLFPHMTVRRNLVYGARSPRLRSGQAGDMTPVDSATVRRFDELSVVPSPVEGRENQGGAQTLAGVAGMLEITPLLDRRVHGLSGGERQRIALGRALMTTPALLLLDEPLAAVDRARRDRILPYLLRIRRELHVPLIYVTHDATELGQIADRVLLIEDGVVLGAGDPTDVLRPP